MGEDEAEGAFMLAQHCRQLGRIRDLPPKLIRWDEDMPQRGPDATLKEQLDRLRQVVAIPWHDVFGNGQTHQAHHELNPRKCLPRVVHRVSVIDDLDRLDARPGRGTRRNHTGMTSPALCLSLLLCFLLSSTSHQTTHRADLPEDHAHVFGVAML